ncbi:hypothetical protein [Brachybacterium sp. GPGPB12]|uniref:hypothetical protein n=1 Tax=Brachybacterium sp. GPGPB12 TaxID=3023517 RepID=UPI003134425A
MSGRGAPATDGEREDGTAGPRRGSGPAPAHRPERAPGRWSALVGVVAGLVLVAVAELVSLAFGSSSAPFVAVGGGVVDIVPPAVKDLVIGLFGTWDKLILFASMFVVYALITAMIGHLASSRPVPAAAALTGLGLFAMAVVLTRAQNTPLDVLPTLLGTLVAVPTLFAPETGRARHDRGGADGLVGADGRAGRRMAAPPFAGRRRPGGRARRGRRRRGARGERRPRTGPPGRPLRLARAAGVRRPDPRRRPGGPRGHAALRHPERRLLPDRHRPRGAERGPRHVDAADPRPGRPGARG